jgi:hypothetical protein
LTVSPENPFFVADESAILSRDKKSFYAHFGSDPRAVIKKEVEIISRNSFESCEMLRELVFEEGSRLKVIEYAFASCGLQAISIPACVEEIKQGFLDCESLCEVTFEPGSRLKSIGASVFSGKNKNDFDSEEC